MAELYTQWKALLISGQKLSFWQDFYVKFYQAFLEADRWKQYLNGVGTTLLVTAMALALGILLGVIVAMIRTAHDQQMPGHRNLLLGLMNAVGKVYTTVIRGTPMMVQLLIMALVIFKSSRSFTSIGALTLGINSGAYVAEIIRAGIMSVDKGQSEAGRSLGLNFVQTMWYIVIPQALKNTLPALANEFIVLLKETSVACYVAVNDLTKGGEIIRSTTYQQFLPLMAVALIYLMLVMFFSWLVGKLERRLRSSDH